MTNESNELKDVFLAYLATLELRVHALENVLEQKGIILSREEIENAQQRLDNAGFEIYISGYDKILDEIHSRMKHLRGR